jgi:hypothetical protein
MGAHKAKQETVYQEACLTVDGKPCRAELDEAREDGTLVFNVVEVDGAEGPGLVWDRPETQQMTTPPRKGLVFYDEYRETVLIDGEEFPISSFVGTPDGLRLPNGKELSAADFMRFPEEARRRISDACYAKALRAAEAEMKILEVRWARKESSGCEPSKAEKDRALSSLDKLVREILDEEPEK